MLGNTAAAGIVSTLILAVAPVHCQQQLHVSMLVQGLSSPDKKVSRGSFISRLPCNKCKFSWLWTISNALRQAATQLSGNTAAARTVSKSGLAVAPVQCQQQPYNSMLVLGLQSHDQKSFSGWFEYVIMELSYAQWFTLFTRNENQIMCCYSLKIM